MSARCYVSIRCRKADLDKHMPTWRETLGANGCEQRDSENPAVLGLDFEEVTYADLFASEGFPWQVPFIGTSAGDSGYSACELAHDGVKLEGEEQDEDPTQRWNQDDEGHYAFPVKNGRPVVDEEWRNYWAFRESVRKYVDEGVPFDGQFAGPIPEPSNQIEELAETITRAINEWHADGACLGSLNAAAKIVQSLK
jgi:hypothetical protein